MRFSKKKFEEDGFCVFDIDKKLVSKSKKKILFLISSILSKKYKLKNITERKIIKLYKSKSLRNKLIQNGSIILESFGSSFLRAKNFLEICKVSLK